MRTGVDGLDRDPLVYCTNDVVAALVCLERHLTSGDHGGMKLANPAREMTWLNRCNAPAHFLFEPGECLSQPLYDLNQR